MDREFCDAVSEPFPDQEKPGYVRRSHCVDPAGHRGLHSWERIKLQELDDANASEPCGESHCICYCIGDCHACGCDCPPSVDGHY
jgi:hypothetical protein